MPRRFRIYNGEDGYVDREFKKKSSAERFKEKHDIRGSIVKREKGFLK